MANLQSIDSCEPLEVDFHTAKNGQLAFMAFRKTWQGGYCGQLRVQVILLLRNGFPDVS